MNHMKPSEAAKERTYWLDRLSGQLEKSGFPIDNKKPGKPGRESTRFTLEDEVFTNLMKLRNGSDHRMHMILTANLLVLLEIYTGNQDILLGIPVDRQKNEGQFINTVLVLRNHIQGNMTFKDLLLQVRKTFTEAIENQNYPVEALLADLEFQVPGDNDGFPLFDIAVVVENIQDKSYLQHIDTKTVFCFSRTDKVVTGELEYDASLYRRGTMEQIAGHFTHLLKQFLANVGRRVSGVDLLTGEERERVLFEFNREETGPAPAKTVHELVDRHVRHAPGNTALVGRDDSHMVTYKELNRRADDLAGLLRSKGVGPDSIVGVMVERSPEMVIGMLGILKAGGAYLPIDIYYPQQRLQYILKDSNIHVLIRGLELQVTTSRSPGMACDWPSPGSGGTGPGNLFYVIYTSGSTGTPKGVLITHRGFINLIYSHRKVFGEDSRSRMSQVASPGFDAMAFEVWPCMASGAVLYFADDETRINSLKLKKWLIKNKIAISYQPTLMAEQLLNEQWPPRGVALRALRAAGDQLTHYPKSSYPFQFYNLYGPTESTVWTTWAEISHRAGSSALPVIGKPIDNHNVYIISSHLKLQPVGIPGELCIAGIGVARGYLNQPELTYGKFIRVTGTGGGHGWEVAGQQSPIYKSGDLARWLSDGNIEFLGRKDYQVKIRGYRIELGEIENQLLQYDRIKEAVVLAKESDQGEKHLYAFVVIDNTDGNVDISMLRAYLAEWLPVYMIPPYFVEVDRIPFTPNGKVDRKELLSLKKVIAEIEYVEPRDRWEKKLVRIWEEMLEVERVGIKDNFFNIGGDSLKSIRLMNAVNESFNRKFELVDIYENETIEKLAQKIAGSEKSTSDNQDKYKDSRERMEAIKEKFMEEL